MDRGVVVADSVEGLGDLSRTTIEQCREQIAARREVAVQGSSGEAGRCCDGVERDVRILQ